MRVIVLHGAVPGEAGKEEEDTLVQVRVVRQTLTELGHETDTVLLTLDTGEARKTLCDLKPDIVFNLVESIAGKGNLIHLAPSLLDALGIPFTGGAVEAVFLTSNKLIAKKILRGEGIDTSPWVSLKELTQPLVVPGLYIIKSVWEHASRGVDDEAVVHTDSSAQLAKMIASRQERLGFPCFAELFIDGREFNLSLLAGKNGPDVLPPAEILFDSYPPEKRRIVDYRAKWEEGSFEYLHTPRRFAFPSEDEPLLRRLSHLAQRCWFLFDLRGYGRIDFRVDRNGIPWILEVNTNPCLSPDAGFAAAAGRAGLPISQVIERIIRDTSPS